MFRCKTAFRQDEHNVESFSSSGNLMLLPAIQNSKTSVVLLATCRHSIHVTLVCRQHEFAPWGPSKAHILVSTPHCQELQLNTVGALSFCVLIPTFYNTWSLPARRYSTRGIPLSYFVGFCWEVFLRPNLMLLVFPVGAKLGFPSISYCWTKLGFALRSRLSNIVGRSSTAQTKSFGFNNSWDRRKQMKA